MQTHLQAEGRRFALGTAGNFMRCCKYDSHTCHQTTPSAYIQNFRVLPLISTQLLLLLLGFHLPFLTKAELGVAFVLAENVSLVP